MYAVVGCNECGTLWLLSDPGKTASCPRCGKRHQTRKLKRFFRSENREEARQARAAMLADKRGERSAFESLDSVAAMESQVEDAGIDDREYLKRSGLDVDAVESAGDVSASRSRSRREIVEDAISEGDRPTESEIVDYAADRGVPAEAAQKLLTKLARRGEVSESGGRYRLL